MPVLRVAVELDHLDGATQEKIFPSSTGVLWIEFVAVLPNVACSRTPWRAPLELVQHPVQFAAHVAAVAFPKRLFLNVRSLSFFPVLLVLTNESFLSIRVSLRRQWTTLLDLIFFGVPFQCGWKTCLPLRRILLQIVFVARTFQIDAIVSTSVGCRHNEHGTPNKK
jgi:hypothetical protein